MSKGLRAKGGALSAERGTADYGPQDKRSEVRCQRSGRKPDNRTTDNGLQDKRSEVRSQMEKLKVEIGMAERKGRSAER